MGNEGSKLKSSHGSLPRSDTGTSQRSNRSLRSRKSNRDDVSSHKSTPNISRRGSFRNQSDLINDMQDMSINGTEQSYYRNKTSRSGSQQFIDKNELVPPMINEPPQSQHQQNSINVDSKSHLYSDQKLPASMAQVKPKSPILRMNSSTSIHDNVQHLSPIDPQHNIYNNNNGTSNNGSIISRRNSSTTVGSNGGHSIHELNANNINNKDKDMAGNIIKTDSPNHSIHHSRTSSLQSRIRTPYNDNNEIIKENTATVNNHDNTNSYNNQSFIDINTNTIDNSNINSDNVNSTINNSLTKKYELNIEDLIQRLLDAGYSGKRTKSVCLKNTEIAMICSTAREIFLSQPPLLELSAPVKIVGDVHGQYTDLIRIFSKCGFPPAANYLFLGDYVDRGKQSLETILLLLCYKIKYPENFFLLRGNHECAQITRQYGFYDECKRRTTLKTWKIFIDTFNTLPIAAIIAQKIFCVHGGLSPVLNSMDEVRNIRRPTDVPDFGLLNDLLWSDPTDSPNEWEDNERGVSYCFNQIAINKFLAKFQFDLVVRAHMVVEDGYEFFNDRSLVTVFSAPNYCGEFDNWGAVMSVSEELLCSFELLDPLDSLALKHLMKKGKIERRNAMLTSNQNLSNQSF